MHGDTIRVGISSCLLGQQVRYDGGHKLSTLCAGELARRFDFVPVCPEVGIGMGVPRKPIRLVGEAASPRALGVEDPALDVTDALRDFGRRTAADLGDLCGYIFIRNSPSCGLFGVKVLGDDGRVREEGRGVHAAEVTRLLPWLPVEEAGRLEEDADLREHFLARVLACHDWRRLQAQGLSAAGLTTFHGTYKYSLTAHDPAGYKALGRLLARAGKEDPVQLGERYFPAFMRSLARRPTRGTHANALLHLLGHLRRGLDERERRDALDLIERYRLGELPLEAPKEYLRQCFARHPDPFAQGQAYLRSIRDCGA